MEAMAWINEHRDYMKQNHGKYQAQIFIDSFGEPGTVRWILDFEDLSALEKFMQEVNEDQGYWQRVAKVEGLFVEGSVHDIVMRSI
jgi:hypothetical protein